jgi:hypothetical protein
MNVSFIRFFTGLVTGFIFHAPKTSTFVFKPPTSFFIGNALPDNLAQDDVVGILAVSALGLPGPEHNIFIFQSGHFPPCLAHERGSV